MNPHQAVSASPREMFSSFWRNRQLIWQMIRRDVASRYRGSVMGFAWSFVTPVLMLSVYTFVFSVVFKSRWSTSGNESKADFAIILFAGLIVQGFFGECINRAPSLIISNVNYVKRVVFPLEIIPWVALGSALFNTLISVVVLLLAQLAFDHALPWTVLMLPVVFLPLILAVAGFDWFLASLGVFVRDIGQVTGIITMVLMFLSPVFYPVSSIPKKYQGLILLNPLTLIIEESRKVLVYGQLPDWFSLGIALLIGLTIASCGFWWFQKTRKGFADVI